MSKRDDEIASVQATERWKDESSEKKDVRSEVLVQRLHSRELVTKATVAIANSLRDNELSGEDVATEVVESALQAQARVDRLQSSELVVLTAQSLTRRTLEARQHTPSAETCRPGWRT